MELTRGQLKRGIVISVSISIIAIIMIIIFTREDISYQMFTRIDSTYFVLACYITVVFWILKALKLQVLAGTLGTTISFPRVLAIYLGSMFVSHVTPSSSGGLPFEIYFLHREGLPLGQSTALAVMENMINLVFFIVGTPILVLFWGHYLNLGVVITRVFYLAMVLVILFVIASLILVFNAGLAMTFTRWILSLKPIKKYVSDTKQEQVEDYVAREISYFQKGIQLLLVNKKDLLLVVVYTVLYWVLYLSLAPILLWGLGLEVALPPVILAQVIFNFIIPVIPTPGGSGGAELSFAYLFKYMIPVHVLGVFVAFWRFFMFYASLIVGGLCFITLVQNTNFLKEEK